MKYGIITDVHCNIIALNLALNKFAEEKVDKIICLGDIVGIGPYPEETVQRMIEIKKRLIGVRGNHETYLLEGLPNEVHDDKRSMSEEEKENHLWNQNQLSDSSKVFLASLSYQTIVEDSGKRILITHYPIDENGNYKLILKNPTIEKCRKIFDCYEADVYLYGHTHSSHMIQDKQKLYVNVGSLGCTMQETVGHCGILTVDETMSEYKDILIPFDITKVTEAMREKKIPMCEKVIAIFFHENR